MLHDRQENPRISLPLLAPFLNQTFHLLSNAHKAPVRMDYME